MHPMANLRNFIEFIHLFQRGVRETFLWDWNPIKFLCFSFVPKDAFVKLQLKQDCWQSYITRFALNGK